MKSKTYQTLVAIAVFSASMLGNITPAHADPATCKKLKDAVSRWEKSVRRQIQDFEASAAEMTSAKRVASQKKIKSSEKSLADARRREVGYGGKC